jgi:hypothetical protein
MYARKGYAIAVPRPSGASKMSEQAMKRKNAEQRISDELANQPKQDPSSTEGEESKERRAKAEKDLNDTK